MKTLKKVTWGVFGTLWCGVTDRLGKKAIEETDEWLDESYEEIAKAETKKEKIKKVAKFCGFYFVRCVMWLMRVFNALFGLMFFCGMFVNDDEQEYIEELEE